MHACSRPLQTQRGAALIIALIFLVVLALIGLSASNVTSMEERMAGNTRDRDLAFQAAEAALAHAFANWDTTANPLGFYNPAPGSTIGAPLDNNSGQTNPRTGSAGLRWIDLDSNANDANFWQNTWDWANDSIQLPANTITTVTTQPRIVFERLMDSGGLQQIRVTARATGNQGGTVIILQEQRICATGVVGC